MIASETFEQRITGAFGVIGRQWLDDLPSLVRSAAARWHLNIGSPFELSYNYVVSARTSAGEPVVLKVLCPDPLAGNEAAALAAFGGDATCHLLDWASDLQAMLLEQVVPGEPLAGLALDDDERATAVAIDVFQRLWKQPPAVHTFLTVEDRANQLQEHRRRFDGRTGPLPSHLFEEAESAFRDLPRHGRGPHLLHGDLHHDNILSSQRAGWLAIDPKGIVGEPGYDLGAFLYNPIPGLLRMPNPGKVIARRIDQLAEGLGFDRSVVRCWGLAQSILSCVWSIEDGLDFTHSLTCAHLIAAVRP